MDNLHLEGWKLDLADLPRNQAISKIMLLSKHTKHSWIKIQDFPDLLSSKHGQWTRNYKKIELRCSKLLMFEVLEFEVEIQCLAIKI